MNRVEVELVGSCTKEFVAKLTYREIVTQFGFHLVLISHRGTHFINGTIQELKKKIMIKHHKTASYYPRAKCVVDWYNRTKNEGLNKICTVDSNELDDKDPTILWAYCTTYKRPTWTTSFKLNLVTKQFYYPIIVKIGN